MNRMKLFRKYLYTLRRTAVWALLCAVCFAAVFALCGIEWRIVWYPLLLSGVLTIGFLLCGYLRFVRKHRMLIYLLEGGGPYGDSLPEPGSLTEEDYQKLILASEQARRTERETWELAQKDTEDYYATWVHQIKAPIAVMRVLLQQADTRENQELKSELFRIEQYVEMVLYYVRLGEGGSDLVIQEHDLDDIIRKAVRKYAGQFVRKRIRLVYQGTDIRVMTDEKWLSFIIEQILSNAVKYTSRGEVTITVDEKKRLSIADTGIGIAAEDLPRIFEKGYTGYNGRVERKSTGIGLYLCKMAADKLGHKLSAESEPGKGSRFTIDLESYPLRVE